MRISVIIPTYNRKDLLRRCLAAATSQDYPNYEVIVVDDGSTDGTEEMVRREFPQVRYLRQETNRGPAAARNRGIREATGEIIAFTDDDCVPPPNWLSRHLQHYTDPDIGAVGGPQVPPSPNLYDKLEIAHYPEEYAGPIQRIERLTGWEGLAASNMSVRQEVFERVGKFDEAFLTGADPEFVRRAVRAGYAIVRDPTLQVTHLKVHTLASYLRMRFRRGCGVVLTDLREHSLSPWRFIPVVNVIRGWQDWRSFQAMFSGGWRAFVCFWGLMFLVRWADVAGRLYYYWRVGRQQ
ncbi:MAG TPA: glycosyltransferase [Caldilineae bacterium]|jgi:GT2 family glycosyltransferase|nr:glycosyltransferase [Caldilineae bacterium]